MPLTATLTATCDAKVTDQGHEVPCEARLELDPNTTQRWLAVVDQGWIVDHLGSPTQTGVDPIYCPDHAAGRL